MPSFPRAKFSSLWLVLMVTACAGAAPHEPSVGSAYVPPPGSSPSVGLPPGSAPGIGVNTANTFLGAPRPLSGSAPRTEVLLDRGEFVASYDEQIHLARWVAWRVRKSDLGRAKRKNLFHPDAELPAGMLRIDTTDYVRSGYDRGHLCPSADRTATDDMNHRTFVMTNMHPQKHGLNAGPWEELEVYTRDLLKRPDDVVYVVAGPLVETNAARIGRGVAVPRASFKVLIALKDGAAARDVSQTVYHAAAIMPNDDVVDGKHWQSYETTIRAVEEASGYDFFSEVPRAVQDVIETTRGTP